MDWQGFGAIMVSVWLGGWGVLKSRQAERVARRSDTRSVQTDSRSRYIGDAVLPPDDSSGKPKLYDMVAELGSTVAENGSRLDNLNDGIEGVMALVRTHRKDSLAELAEVRSDLRDLRTESGTRFERLEKTVADQHDLAKRLGEIERAVADQHDLARRLTECERLLRSVPGIGGQES
jgi:hypothetical protein